MDLQVCGLTLELAGAAVVSDLSFSVCPGERVVLLGVNGCGKTTLLKALDGLVAPCAGTIRYGGTALDPRALEDATFRRRFRSEVALLFQNVDAMLFNPTVADEIAFGPMDIRAARATRFFSPPDSSKGGRSRKRSTSNARAQRATRASTSATPS